MVKKILGGSFMGKYKKQDKKKEEDKLANPLTSRWISMSTGVKVIIFTSIALAVIIGTQTVPALGWFEGSLWAIGYGAMIWVIFYGMLYVNKLLHR
jgi:hypothetical protein